MAIMLSPRSKRMQYGLDLTRALQQRIQESAQTHGGKMAIFQVDEKTFDSDADEIYVLNGKYFRVSKRQFEENWQYVNQGFTAQVFPVTVKDWRVAPDDGHLNQAANDQIMSDLARWLQQQIPEKKP
jgi:lysophospholipase L1-like esterase